ncbi:alpha/beta hydrolase [Nocardioides dubius]
MIDLTPAEARERIVTGNRLCSAGPDVVIRDVEPGEDGAPVALRLYGPPTDITLVYAHGGGWVTGGLDYADEFCRFLAAECGVQVVSIDYRLAPEHRFPAPLDDLAAAWDWTAERYPGVLALGGDSAGGNLAAALALRLRGTTREPAFQLLLYPVLGAPGVTESYTSRADAFPIGATDMHWFFDHYVDRDARDTAGPDLLPLSAGDLSGLPVTHVVAAGHDPLRDEAIDYAARLKDAGVAVTVQEHPELCHGFLRFTGASAAARAARAGVLDAVRQLAQGLVNHAP